MTPVVLQAHLRVSEIITQNCPPTLYNNDKMLMGYRNYLFFKRFYLFIVREKGREGEREGEKHQCVVVSCSLPTNGDLARNPSICRAWESNWWPFGSQASTQTTEPCQPGQKLLIIVTLSYKKEGYIGHDYKLWDTHKQEKHSDFRHAFSGD